MEVRVLEISAHHEQVAARERELLVNVLSNLEKPVQRMLAEGNASSFYMAERMPLRKAFHDTVSTHR